MTRIQINDCIMEVDLMKTKEYYASINMCSCCECRNFYAQAKTLTQLDAFLSQFGIDICRPDESSSMDVDGMIQHLFIGYTVTGVIEKGEGCEVKVGDYQISISKGQTLYDWFPNEQKEPCFFISVSGVTLPWVLDEPYPETQMPTYKKIPLFSKFKKRFRKK